ncbi:MAG: DUF5660 domain-containing protein [Patescibacteria group bacterium]|nr:DUF5660 domain-containing protein [Patescibacteria group bacterium]
MPNHDSIVETFRDLGSGIKQGIQHDLIQQGAQDAFQALFGQMLPQEYGRNPFEQFPFGKKETPKPIQRPEILSPHRIAEEQARTKQQIEAIRAELSLLAQSVGQLNQEVEKAIMEVPVDPGIYHINFFERLRRVIQMIRKRVNDSNEWLQLSYSRKKQKGYWAMYKKQGTKFGLSADRTPQTQVG